MVVPLIKKKIFTRIFYNHECDLFSFSSSSSSDLFYTRVNPSKMFDVLKDDFDYIFISSVLIGMIVVSVVSQKLAARKALNRAWR